MTEPTATPGDPATKGLFAGAQTPHAWNALEGEAARVLQLLHRHNLTVATAESCTGGFISALLTDVDGLSHCFERGFAVYTDEAKAEMLGVDPMAIERHGAVSGEVAAAMALGALAHSRAGVAVSVTGYAGPAGPHEQGLVHLFALRRGGRTIARECHFGNCGRSACRIRAACAALEMLADAITA